MDENKVRQNMIPLICKAYGLEKGEVFRIEFTPGKEPTGYAYKFTDKGLVHQFWGDYENRNKNWTPSPADFLSLLSGSATVIKMGLTEPCPIQYEKPPLGLMPYWIFRGKRIYDIICAVKRYANYGKKIPGEWLEELQKYCEELDEEIGDAKK